MKELRKACNREGTGRGASRRVWFTQNHQCTAGMTLIDVLVGTALLLVIFLALLGALRASLTLSAIDKAEATAVEIANTQLEYLHGLDYGSLGTQGGIPAGSIVQDATTTIDGEPYAVHTFIGYYDDPADGLGASDTNGITTDYKKAVVVVSYKAGGLARDVTLSSTFAPPGIESNTGGGTLAVHVVDATGIDVSGASVRVVNTSTSPTIDFTTLTDASGLASVLGAATSSDYQIYVSKIGYSAAQTYPRTATNVNPTPGDLTVAPNLTTTITFAIDQLATLTISTLSPATTTAFVDTFTSSADLAQQTNTLVSSGAVHLAGNALTGSVLSIPFSPSYLDGWGVLQADFATSNDSSITLHVLDASGNVLPDSALAGNSVGFSSFPVFLTDLSTSTYPTLALSATMSRTSTSSDPLLRSWSLSHTQGPAPLGNSRFMLTGTKTIGSTASSAPLYKTQLSGSTAANGSVTEQLEWDAYTLSASSTVLESCPSNPHQLLPGSATTTTVVQGDAGSASLAATVVTPTKSPIAGAVATLSTADSAVTVPTDRCGIAYFAQLVPGSYNLKVRATGYTTQTSLNLAVVGTATTTVTLSP